MEVNSLISELTALSEKTGSATIEKALAEIKEIHESQRVSMEFTASEICFLITVMNRIGGNPECTDRGIADSIRVRLCDLIKDVDKVLVRDAAVNASYGSITFTGKANYPFVVLNIPGTEAHE